MTSINRVYGNSGPGPVRQETRLPSTEPTPGDNAKPQDQVEISEAAQLLSKMSQLPEIRKDKVEQVRQAILQGDYETPDKIAITADRILKELTAEAEG
jgi:flagellar biosynthesis anti-sigma factor FlgM